MPLWEQVAYLAGDTNRLAAYQLLEEKVGTTHIRFWVSTPMVCACSLAKLAAEAELAPAVAARQSAYLLLRHHGQTLCRPLGADV